MTHLARSVALQARCTLPGTVMSMFRLGKLWNCHLTLPPLSSHAYVIELLSPPPNSPGIKGVDLDIRELDDLPWGHETQFNLVIKSPPGIKWTVHTPKMEGKVEIAVSL